MHPGHQTWDLLPCYWHLVTNTRDLSNTVHFTTPSPLDIWQHPLKHVRFASGWYASYSNAFLLMHYFFSESNWKNVLHPFKMLKSKNLIQTTERFIELNPHSVIYVNMYMCGKATTKRLYNAVNTQVQRVQISNAPTPCKSERPSPNHIKSTQIFMVMLQTKHHLKIALCPRSSNADTAHYQKR